MISESLKLTFKVQRSYYKNNCMEFNQFCCLVGWINFRYNKVLSLAGNLSFYSLRYRQM